MNYSWYEISKDVRHGMAWHGMAWDHAPPRGVPQQLQQCTVKKKNFELHIVHIYKTEDRELGAKNRVPEHPKPKQKVKFTSTVLYGSAGRVFANLNKQTRNEDRIDPPQLS
jgi:hypothetical protein